MKTFALITILASSCFRSELSPLIDAARSGDAQGIRALVARGNDPNASAGGNGWTPLEHAVHKHQVGSLTALLDAGADPNRSSREGTTPLMMAAGYGYTDMVQILLRRGANPRLTDRHGMTALDLAITGVSDIDRFTLFDCQNETVKVLQAAGAPAGAAKTLARIKKC
jgi:ankyrin repeat protein